MKPPAPCAWPRAAAGGSAPSPSLHPQPLLVPSPPRCPLANCPQPLQPVPSVPPSTYSSCCVTRALLGSRGLRVGERGAGGDEALRRGTPQASPRDKRHPSSMAAISQVNTTCIYCSEETLSFLPPLLLHVRSEIAAASYETLPPLLAMGSQRAGLGRSLSLHAQG